MTTMNTPKHTPLDKAVHAIPMLYAEAFAGSNNKEFVVELYSDARLLETAAPAMYEALKALHSVLDQRMPDGRTLNQHLSQEVFECFYGPAIAARAAIAKAEGA